MRNTFTCCPHAPASRVPVLRPLVRNQVCEVRAGVGRHEVAGRDARVGRVNLRCPQHHPLLQVSSLGTQLQVFTARRTGGDGCGHERAQRPHGRPVDRGDHIHAVAVSRVPHVGFVCQHLVGEEGGGENVNEM